MSDLKRIFDLQKNYEKKFLEFKNINLENITKEERQQYTKEWILCLIKEATEVLDCINWKDHKLQKFEVNRSNLVEELIDVFKFYLAIVTLWDINDKDFHEAFERKSIVVAQKFEQEKLLFFKNYTKICALDIDGILYPWPEAFVDFCNANFAEFDGIATFKEIETNPNIRNKLKNEYRLSGIKATAGVIEGASEFTNLLKEKGYTIILLTSRPYQKYQRIYADTLEWLNKHDIKFDAIIWEDQKEDYLAKNLPYVEFVIEDDAENIAKLVSYGFKVWGKMTPYNSSTRINGVRWFNNLDELKDYI